MKDQLTLFPATQSKAAIKRAKAAAYDAANKKRCLEILHSINGMTEADVQDHIRRCQPRSKADPVATMGIGRDLSDAVLRPVMDHPQLHPDMKIRVWRVVQTMVCNRSWDVA